MTPRSKALVEDVGAGGVATGGETGAMATGVEAVILVSGTNVAADLCPLGTLWNTCVVALPFLSSASSWSSSTAV